MTLSNEENNLEKKAFDISLRFESVFGRLKNDSTQLEKIFDTKKTAKEKNNNVNIENLKLVLTLIEDDLGQYDNLITKYKKYKASDEYKKLIEDLKKNYGDAKDQLEDIRSESLL